MSRTSRAYVADDETQPPVDDRDKVFRNATVSLIRLLAQGVALDPADKALVETHIAAILGDEVIIIEEAPEEALDDD